MTQAKRQGDSDIRQRLSLTLSATALVIALLGATPLGQAAGRLAAGIPPFARKSGYATTAGNALLLNGHKASAAGGAGVIPVLDGSGRLPASTGAVGPPGPQGPAGAKGDKGDPGKDGAGAKLWAFVRGDGSYFDSSGVTRVYHDGPGAYRVQFNYDLTHCALLATPAVSFYRIGAGVYGANPLMASVGVRGGADNTFQDGPFSIAAICP